MLFMVKKLRFEFLEGSRESNPAVDRLPYGLEFYGVVDDLILVKGVLFVVVVEHAVDKSQRMVAGDDEEAAARVLLDKGRNLDILSEEVALRLLCTFFE